MNNMKKIAKKLFRWLQLWEGVWLVPILFILFLLMSSFLVYLWGPEVGIFRPGLINKVFLGTFVYFLGLSVVNITINLYHRGWFRYYYSKRSKLTQEIAPHVKNDFEKIPAWVRVIFIPVLQLLLLALYFYVVVDVVK
jgi:hypothetical protein